MRQFILITFTSALLAALTTPALGACEEPGERSAILLSVARAEQAFQQMDLDGFRAACDAALAGLGCLGDPLQPADAARIHALSALDAFTRNSDADAVNAFRSALRADPSFVLGPDLVPEGHVLRLQLQVASSVADGPPRTLPAWEGEYLLVDGTPSAEVPTDRPFVLQRSHDDRSVVASAYVPTKGDLPDWAVPLVPESSSVGLVIEPPNHTPTRPWLLAGASGACAVASGVLWAMTASSHAEFMDSSTPYEDLPGLRQRTNTLDSLTIGATALTLSFGTVAVVRW
jgi:hypothetical protein